MALHSHATDQTDRELRAVIATLLRAIMDALAAHTTMSSQALNSQKIRDGLRDTLLGLAQLYEAPRARTQAPTAHL